MNSKKLLSLWGLKWNPFSPELPSEGLLVTPRIEHFAWRVEQLVQEGGFALITGESGTGKSVALRIVAGRLSTVRDVVVGVIERPQSKSSDFYRELGDIFAVKLAPHNRWGGFKALRGPRLHHAEHGQRKSPGQSRQRHRRDRVAGHHEELEVELREEAAVVERVARDDRRRTGPVGHARGVPEVDDRLVREATAEGREDGQAADARIENADRATPRGA